MAKRDPTKLHLAQPGRLAFVPAHSNVSVPTLVTASAGSFYEELRLADETRRLSALPADFRVRLGRGLAQGPSYTLTTSGQLTQSELKAEGQGGPATAVRAG